MRRHSRCILVFTTGLLFALALAALWAGDAFPFKTDDRVLFLGDSITEQYHYTTDIEIYLTTRFPRWHLTFFNAGIGGDTAAGGRSRLERDVLVERPTIVLVNFGMNDAGYDHPSEQRFRDYITNQTELTQRILGAKVRLVLLSSSAVEARQNPARLVQYNDVLARFAQGLRGVAEKEGALFVDQHTPERDILEQMTKDKAPFHAFNDGIHTTPLGGILMARAILLGLHAPAVVSSVTLDARSQKVLTSERTSISNIRFNQDVLSFDRLDEALPMVPSNPSPEGWLQIYPYLNNLDDLNYYGLRIEHLTASRYKLFIDGQDAGTLNRNDLQAGLNLAPHHLGPIGVQAYRVAQAIENKNNRYKQRYNSVRRSGVPDNFSVLEILQRQRVLRNEEARLFDGLFVPTPDSIYQLAVPTAHHFELRPE